MSEDLAPRATEEALVAAVEAVLFAAAEPVRVEEIASAFESEEPAHIEAALCALSRMYDERRSGLRLERVAGGFRLATRHEVGAWVRRFFRQRNRTRLSPAALETLAIVAYRQPVTLPEIQAIRGVDPGAALKSLLDKKLVRILGRKKVVGNPLLYGTSRNFLVHFGLNGLEDLPSIDDFEQFLGAIDGAPPPLFGNAGEGADYEPLTPEEAAAFGAVAGEEAGPEETAGEAEGPAGPPGAEVENEAPEHA